ncbi:MAG TPA: DUF1080 domain-containing protein [Luteolibacter sp.]|nr:DUF1080 domain-containing protein [Luteolibacter sp.]
MKTISLLLALAALVTPGMAEDPVFRPLFNGKDLTGWVGGPYTYEGDAIVCPTTKKGRTLRTEATFTNYILEFEFKLPANGNNGIGIHYPGQGDPAYTGMELQILDDSGSKYTKLKDTQYHGSLYTLQPAKKGFLKPVGEWNHQRIEVNGKSVKVILNGTEILNADLEDLALKNKGHKGVNRREGHIALCGHGFAVAFRNMRIAEIK